MPANTDSRYTITTTTDSLGVVQFEMTLNPDYVPQGIEPLEIAMPRPRRSLWQGNREIAEQMLDYTMKNGGGTFNEAGTPYEGGGFIVAIARETYRIISMDNAELAVDAIMDVARDYRFNWIGTWIEGGFIHIDPVIYCDKPSTAESYARDYGQRAYFDMEKRESVYVSRRR